MCYFLTAVLSADGDLVAVRNVAHSNLLRWEPIENPPVRRWLAPGDGYFFTTHGMCDCNTAIGSALRPIAHHREVDPKRQRQKLRKKGWSEAKIERHLHDQQTAQQRQLEALERRKPTADDPEIVRWLTFLRTVLETAAASRVGFLLHFYNGTVMDEAIVLQGQETLALAALNGERLLAAEADVLYTVRR